MSVTSLSKGIGAYAPPSWAGDRRAAIWFALAVVVGLGVLSYASIEMRHAAAARAERDHAVIHNLDELLTLLKDAQFAGSGYAVTGERRFLDLYDAAAAAAPAIVARLSDLIAGDAGQQQRLARLAELISDRFGALDRVALLANPGSAASGRALL